MTANQLFIERNRGASGGEADRAGRAVETIQKPGQVIRAGNRCSFMVFSQDQIDFFSAVDFKFHWIRFAFHSGVVQCSLQSIPKLIDQAARHPIRRRIIGAAGDEIKHGIDRIKNEG
jgi:hypothetical protein